MVDIAKLSGDPGDISLQLLFVLRDEMRRRGYQQDTPEHLQTCVTAIGYLCARLAGVTTDPVTTILTIGRLVRDPATLRLANAIRAALEDMAAIDLATKASTPERKKPNVVPLKPH